MRRRVWAAIAATALTTWSAAARADGTADEADLHFQMGTADFQRGDYSAALAHFLLSNRLAPNRNVGFNIASAYEQLKRYADAHRYYVEALAGETDPRAIQDIRAALARITPFVAVLDVVTSPPGATIYVDRKDLGSRGKAPQKLALPEGKYRIVAELEGYDPQTSEVVEARKGGEAKVSLSLSRIVGTVRVDVQGGKAAVVRIDDERGAPACTAPCDLTLAPGRHELFFSAEGFVSAPRAVTVAARKRTTVTAVLAPLTGSIVVQANEAAALVTVDGQPSGFTPVVLRGVPAGRRRVRVSQRGFTPYEAVLDVKPGQEAQLVDVALDPVREVNAVSRTTEQIDDAPSSVSIIDAQELRAFGYPTIAHALRGVRGVTISSDRVYSSASIRGIGQPNDYGNRLLVLSDGASLNDDILNSSYIGSDGRADLEDVDRIEVVRGPGSLLYGAGAFSGVVNLVPRSRDERSGAHVGFGIYDGAAVHGRVGFHYNVTPDAGLWASVSAARSDGVEAAFPTDERDGDPEILVARGVDAFSSVGTAGRAWWGPVTAQWFYHRRDLSVPIGAYATLFNNPRTAAVDSRVMGEVRVEPRLSDRVEVMARAHANHYLFEGLYTFREAENVEELRGTWFGGEARVALRPIPELRITVGGEGQIHPDVALHGVAVGREGTSTYLDQESPYQFAAGYGVVEASPLPWLRASGGARIDVYSTFGPIVVPRAALVFNLARLSAPAGSARRLNGGVLKVMGGRAFRAPSIYEQVYNDNSLSQVPAIDEARGLTIGPESVYSGEVEYSHRFLDDWVALGAGHASYVEGIINTVPDAPGSTLVRYANSDVPVLVVGGDVEIRRDFRRGWMLAAMYGFQEARFLDSGEEDPRVVNAPQHLASLRGVAPVVAELASLALRLTLEAPRRISAGSEEETPLALVADATISGALRDYGLRYTVGVYNISDRRYEVPASETFLRPTVPQNGRTFLVNVLGTYP